MSKPSLNENLDALRIDRSAPARRRSKGWLWLGAVAALLLIGGGSSWWWLGARAGVEVRTLVVREEAVSGGASATVLNASGYVTARRQATVASKITGRLVEVRVEEGLPVVEGQVLARLDDAQHRASLELAASRLVAAERSIEQTQSRLKLARTKLGRTRRLVEAGVVDHEQRDEDETTVETLEAQLAVERQQVIVAEHEVALGRTQLDDTVIRAPFDGVVVSKDAQPGEMVSPNSAGGSFTRTGICTIVDMSSLEIEVDVNESYISRVHTGQRVDATLDAYPDWRIPGSVITRIPAADRQKATVLVRIGFDELDPRILPDMGIKVAFREQEQPTSGTSPPRRRILIPRSAVRDDGGRDVVFLLVDGRAERRAVNVGGATDDRLIVMAGLSAGEQVIVDTPEHLRDGDRVTTP